MFLFKLIEYELNIFIFIDLIFFVLICYLQMRARKKKLCLLIICFVITGCPAGPTMLRASVNVMLKYEI